MAGQLECGLAEQGSIVAVRTKSCIDHFVFQVEQTQFAVGFLGDQEVGSIEVLGTGRRDGSQGTEGVPVGEDGQCLDACGRRDPHVASVGALRRVQQGGERPGEESGARHADCAFGQPVALGVEERPVPRPDRGWTWTGTGRPECRRWCPDGQPGCRAYPPPPTVPRRRPVVLRSSSPSMKNPCRAPTFPFATIMASGSVGICNEGALAVSR